MYYGAFDIGILIKVLGSWVVMEFFLSLYLFLAFYVIASLWWMIFMFSSILVKGRFVFLEGMEGMEGRGGSFISFYFFSLLTGSMTVYLIF